jgi:hypothetical protein
MFLSTFIDGYSIDCLTTNKVDSLSLQGFPRFIPVYMATNLCGTNF